MPLLSVKMIVLQSYIEPAAANCKIHPTALPVAVMVYPACLQWFACGAESNNS